MSGKIKSLVRQKGDWGHAGASLVIEDVDVRALQGTKTLRQIASSA